MLVIRAGIHKIANKGDPETNSADPDQRLLRQKQFAIWVCTVCLDPIDRQLVFRILEHFP